MDVELSEFFCKDICGIIEEYRVPDRTQIERNFSAVMWELNFITKYHPENDRKKFPTLLFRLDVRVKRKFIYCLYFIRNLGLILERPDMRVTSSRLKIMKKIELPFRNLAIQHQKDI